MSLRMCLVKLKALGGQERQAGGRAVLPGGIGTVHGAMTVLVSTMGLSLTEG
jgi:hypothetical protein